MSNKSKKITFINSDSFFDKDYLFIHKNPEHLLFPFYALKEEFLKRNIEIHTSDLLSKDEADFIVYNEVPKRNLFGMRSAPACNEFEKSFLMLLECPIIRPDNFDEKYHSKFKNVFTWDDKLVEKDPKKYIKFNFMQSFQKPIGNNKRNKFCVCVSGNKKVKHVDELYSKRLEIIEWFESNAIENFDLYGRGWGHIKFNSDSILRPLNRLMSFLPEHNQRKSWKGSVDNKLELLQKYKFNLCIENAKNFHGYITEKLFDSFRAGCVPVYSGPPNIKEYIPRNCFIDLNEFKNFEHCYEYMLNLSEEDLKIYTNAIDDFLKSETAKQFNYKTFIDIFIKTLGL